MGVAVIIPSHVDDEYVDCFQFLTIKNKAAMNIHEQVFVWAYVLFVCFCFCFYCVDLNKRIEKTLVMQIEPKKEPCLKPLQKQTKLRNKVLFILIVFNTLYFR